MYKNNNPYSEKIGFNYKIIASIIFCTGFVFYISLLYVINLK